MRCCPTATPPWRSGTPGYSPCWRTWPPCPGCWRAAAGGGALELDTRESYVVCDESGTPVDVVLRTPGISEGLIESFMLAANECVAEHLNRLDKPCVYRVHEKPSLDKAETLRAMLAPWATI